MLVTSGQRTMTASSEIIVQRVDHILCLRVVTRGGTREFSKSEGDEQYMWESVVEFVPYSQLRGRDPPITQRL